MNRMAIVEKIAVPAFVLIIAAALGGQAYADGANPGIASSISSTSQTSSPGKGTQVPGGGGLNPADPGAVEWIDRPGNNLIFGSAFLGVVAVAPFVAGLTFFGFGAKSGRDREGFCDSCIDNMVGGLCLALTGLLLFPSVMLGVAGHQRAKEAERAAKQTRLEPFLNPLMDRKNDTISLSGAVLGLKGTF